MLNNIRYKKCTIPLVGTCIIFGTMVVLTLSVINLLKINQKFNEIIDDDDNILAVNSKAFRQSTNRNLLTSIHIEEVMSHLNELQRIANTSNGTRAINTIGFDRTLDYISNYLTANTNYKVTKTLYYVISSDLVDQPIFMSSINNQTINHTYSTDITNADFIEMHHTASAKFTDYIPLTVIPNVGCTDDDWLNARPAPEGRVALVKRGECSFVEKAVLAAKYNAVALLVFNDGTAPDRLSTISATLGDNNTVPALFLSFQLGQTLVDAAQRTPEDIRVFLNISRLYEFPFLSANLCADTPTGDITQTIIIGSHADSVPAGPGINDNGSGSAANLALAVALARLFRTSTYTKYKYRVRFCWWGAEEAGLVGSDFHVKQAKNSTTEGERLSDYLINLNYDMLGSPNYIFGIYDGRTARNDTPSQALAGSNKITDLFKQWFTKENLPWDYTDFSGRSDYGPFLAAGIVAGGLFSGANDKKTQEERDRYDGILGQGMGGIPDIIHDPCYHKACDSIQNINVFAYEKMVQAAAYSLEYLGQHDDLKTWLYPSALTGRFNVRSQYESYHEYNSVNEYFNLSSI